MQSAHAKPLNKQKKKQTIQFKSMKPQTLLKLSFPRMLEKKLDVRKLLCLIMARQQRTLIVALNANISTLCVWCFAETLDSAADIILWYHACYSAHLTPLLLKKICHYILHWQLFFSLVLFIVYENKISITKLIFHQISLLLSKITSEVVKSIDQKLNWQRSHRISDCAIIEAILGYSV